MSRETDIKYIDNRLYHIAEEYKGLASQQSDSDEMLHMDFVSDMIDDIRFDMEKLIMREFLSDDDLSPDRTMWEIYYQLLDQEELSNLTSFIFEYKDEFYISEWSRGRWSDPRKIARLG